MRPFLVALSLLLAVPGASAADFTLRSSDLPAGAAIPLRHVFNGFGCSGDNVSPALSWSHPPAGTRSFALLVHDPDAPTGGSGWWHWVVIDLPASLLSLPAGAGLSDGSALPPGARQVGTDYGLPGWGGPCPPAGDPPHRYIFSLHALKVEKLPLPAGATAALAGFLVNANSLGAATFTATYGR
ncbi:YbhB/YbcL family Raf kinase inhibitor-like protein [Cyanobium gracile]|uniref:YbhB/YbcL family Raf kinase inhibitor-like protein n=1 Tax=Cyanobium gracile UHCC 0281 TaxID=3110309 RepID=A0ABU5SVP0_9CYAN|nr:YbhB/YbcL family Raf kinase inhibitor-like protein [Cyanobium gracile]MEA5442585.1 YbhB/YbcL family Raf kinase inhibitor-like protein [Cyanobium gracile UHCC 0281]